MILRFYKSLYLTKKLYLSTILVAIIFIISYFYKPLFIAGKLGILVIIVLLIIDITLLYGLKNKKIKASRILPKRFSNGDDNKVILNIANQYPFEIDMEIIDELPYLFQKRDFVIKKKINPSSSKQITYILRPTKRGEYEFGNLIVYASSKIAFVQKRFNFNQNQKVQVYPSFLKLKQYKLMAISNRLQTDGSRKIKRLTNNNKEFEQIKEYVQGDDYRKINWKSTARMNKLMINQFKDEKSQHIYNVIDLGRNMKMPFAGMTLADYAINASLAIADISMLKDDKAGLITFSKQVHKTIKADKKSTQLQTITEALYNETSDFQESDFEQLYMQIRSICNQKSLLIIYTNFESLISLKRQLKIIRQLTRYHVVLLVFFKNTDIENLQLQQSKKLQHVYFKTIIEKLIYEKHKIVQELENNGVYALLTTPENLSIDVINTYLKFKDKGVI